MLVLILAAKFGGQVLAARETVTRQNAAVDPSVACAASAHNKLCLIFETVLCSLLFVVTASIIITDLSYADIVCQRKNM